MMNNLDLIKKLEKLGLNQKQAKVYLTLLNKGVMTPLELAETTGINRTTVYRLLDDLNKLGLIETILENKRSLAKAVEPEKLKLLVAEKEADLKSLEQEMPLIIKQLREIKNSASNSSTRVVYFKGQNGLKQMMWNVLKTKKEHLGYGYANWNKALGRKFAENLRQEIVDRQIHSREMLNNNQIMDLGKWTKVKDYGRFYEGRFMPKSIIEINHDTYIYNDVFAFSYFYKNELFGVEIHNQEVTKTQRQIFEVLWKIAKKV